MNSTVANVDYVSVTPVRLVFLTNSSVGDTQCFEIEVLNDNILEGDHAFSLELVDTSPSVIRIGMPSTASVTIVDDESM